MRLSVTETARDTSAAMSCSCILLCYSRAVRGFSLRSLPFASCLALSVKRQNVSPAAIWTRYLDPMPRATERPIAEQRRGRPDSGADAFLESLIAEPLTVGHRSCRHP